MRFTTRKMNTQSQSFTRQQVINIKATIYIYEQSNENKSEISVLANFSRDIYRNGKLELLKFKLGEPIPRFIKVNIHTGETIRFLTLDRMSSEDQIIFRGILRGEGKIGVNP